jgi:hypothetical protein
MHSKFIDLINWYIQFEQSQTLKFQIIIIIIIICRFCKYAILAVQFINRRCHVIKTRSVIF